MTGVIKAEKLGKKYIIGHQRQRYRQSMRDVMTHTARGIWQRMRHPLSPNRELLDMEELWAIKDINFEVQQAERIGIIGRNGAGKSTLLKILSRITEPTTGKVCIKGRVSSLLEVGTGFHPELSGRENIYLNGAILGMTRQEIKRKFDEIVSFAEVEKFLDTPVKRYSSGMYVRLAFAVAAHLEPEILIVDEVLAVGDVQFQKKCLDKMQDVAGEGRTVLFVSHNMYSVRELCSSAMLLDHGRIIIAGPTGEVVDHYLESNYAQEGEIYLDNWEGTRTSPGTARVSVVRTLNKYGEICSVFEIGKSIMFEADVTNLPSNGFVVSFSVSNKQGVLVYHVRSQDSELVTAGAGSSTRVRMTIPEIRVVEGPYTVNVWLGNHLNQLEDRVESALAFHVLNKGHSVNRLLSVIHETGQWELVRTEIGKMWSHARSFS